MSVNRRSRAAIYLAATGPGCQATPRRLEDIARDVQAIGGVAGYNALWTCSQGYLVSGGDAASIRNAHLIHFGFDVRQPSFIMITGTRTLLAGASADPAGIVIQSSGGLVTDCGRRRLRARRRRMGAQRSAVARICAIRPPSLRCRP